MTPATELRGKLDYLDHMVIILEILNTLIFSIMTFENNIVIVFFSQPKQTSPVSTSQ